MATAFQSPCSELTYSPRLVVKISFACTLVGTILAMGIVDNQSSYVLIPLLVLTLYRRRQCKLRSAHLWFWASTIFLMFYGTVLGILNGNNIGYALRFTAPLLVFSLFLPARNLATVFFDYRRELNVLIFLFTQFVYLLTALSLNDLSLLLLRGWTLSFSTTSAIGVWHYFAMPFAGVMIYEFLYFKRSGAALMHALIGTATLVFLWMTTVSSAFKLACLVLIIFLLVPSKRISFLFRGLPLMVLVIVLDYATVQIISRQVVSYIAENVSDEGDLIRLVQINYFIDKIKLTGHGFGVAHDFVFENKQRQLSHEAFPYASELPFLNLIHGGGLPAAIWVAFVGLTATLLLKNLVSSRTRELRLYSFFAFSCSLVLIGSISNPFLFSPVSMLLIAIGFNSLEHYDRMRQSSLNTRINMPSKI